MHWKEGDALVSWNDGPKLATTDVFDSLLDTLPDDCPVPIPIVKFGLLTRHAKPASEDFEIDFDKKNIESSETAVVPAETLSAVEYILYHHCEHLSAKEKQRIGRFCEVTHLSRANELGASESAVRKAVDDAGMEDYPFILRTKYSCKHCGDEFDTKTALNSHVTDCGPDTGTEESTTAQSSQQSSSEKRPALGKEIRKDKGSERVSGRNPFADTDRLKDTGLHQGGGS